MPQEKSLKRLAGKTKPVMADDAGTEKNGDNGAKRRRKSKGGANGAKENPAPEREATSEDDGEATNAVRDMGCAVRADVDDAGGDGWRKALEELRKTRKPQERVAQKADAGGPPMKERLLAIVRSAIESGKWAAVTSPMAFPRPVDISAVARQLDADEVYALLVACAKRYESHPRDRFICSGWILQALEDGGEEATGRKVVRRKLRPLLRALAQRVGPAGRSGEVLSCLGKWRYTAELAAVRRETMKANSEEPVAAGAAAPRKAAAKKGGEEEEASDGDDHEAEDEAEAGHDDSDE
mmetsp:Transcript_70228/g.184087  ORF Transcript_70228/g.184087 Transcript_70228/m.184087 type:complete len:296 (-) Transcript_70228:108-995(-)